MHWIQLRIPILKNQIIIKDNPKEILFSSDSTKNGNYALADIKKCQKELIPNASSNLPRVRQVYRTRVDF